MRALHGQRGVSLIEALVAMTVMAFGMLGIVGVQSTLRQNADIAKQRSEAVRLAQQAVENARSFAWVETVAGVNDYADLVSVSDVVNSTNATYTVERLVTASGDTGSSDDPRMKRLTVNASWSDRSGQVQTVVLDTSIARVMPELSGALGLAANMGVNGLPTRGPMGRNINIPRDAVNFGSSTSGYIPPGRQPGDTSAWLFNNITGLITLCTSNLTSNAELANYFATNGTNPLICTGANAMPVTGSIAFGAAGIAAEATSPTGVAQATTVSVAQTEPSEFVGTVACYTTALQAGVPYISYLCAVPVSASSRPPYAWSGSTSVVTATASQVCRYTYTTTPLANWQHPQTYSLLNVPLSQQNFLVLPAGSSCPSLSGTSTTAAP